MYRKGLLLGCVMTVLLSSATMTSFEGKERYPATRKAVKSLEAAKAELLSASHDFGGHRAEALEAVEIAIRQLNQILSYEGPAPPTPTPKSRPR